MPDGYGDAGHRRPWQPSALQTPQLLAKGARARGSITRPCDHCIYQQIGNRSRPIAMEPAMCIVCTIDLLIDLMLDRPQPKGFCRIPYIWTSTETLGLRPSHPDWAMWGSRCPGMGHVGGAVPWNGPCEGRGAVARGSSAGQ